MTNLGLLGIFLTSLSMLAVAIVTCITQSVIAIQAERFEETRLQVQTIFDSLKEGVIVLDRDHNIIRINRAAGEMFGIPDAVLSKNQITDTFQVFLPEGQELRYESWPSVLALKGEYLQNLELEIRRKDKTRDTIVEVSTAPIFDRHGNAAQVIVSYRDITQPKEVDRARIRLAAIVESSEDAIIGKDTDGIVTSWNAGAEKIFGYSAREMIGHSIKVILPEDRLHEEDNILRRIKAGEVVDHFETIRKRKNGQFMNISLTVSPIRDASGKVIGASKIARNITDRKQMESRLYESQKMEAIGQLTGGIAHDFNNLLGVIVGNLDLLERSVPGNEAALKRIITAQKASTRGADLTRRLLAFARNEQLSPAPLQIDVPIHNTIELASRVLGAEIQIITHLAPAMPSVLVDASGLENAILNIFVNARDAMPKGGIVIVSSTLEVVVRDQIHRSTDLSPGRYVCVSISDTGTGMSRESLERAFEPFYTTKERSKGTGLGLAMVYGFFKQSGGTVHIYSEPGYGTTVSFYLPVVRTEGVPPTLQIVEDEEAPITPCTILLVDDEPDLLEIAFTYLTEASCTVLHAKDGRNAIEILRLRPNINLLITDVIMPGGMDGIDLAREALALQPALKVIYCSGFPATALADRNMELIEGPLLRKPYHRKELFALIRKAMRNDPATGFSSKQVEGGHNGA